jgi:hypothetical protein
VSGLSNAGLWKRSPRGVHAIQRPSRQVLGRIAGTRPARYTRRPMSDSPSHVYATALAALTPGGGWHRLPITTTWDGLASDVSAWVAFRLEVGRLDVVVGAFEPVPVCPSTPAGASTDRLWEYSVVELFLATSAGYLEVELGPDGRHLVYSFASPRVRTGAQEARSAHGIPIPPGKGWASAASFDRSPVLSDPGAPIEKVNAFAHLPGRVAGTPSDSRLFAFNPLPGPRPDFHQPTRFPRWTAR